MWKGPTRLSFHDNGYEVSFVFAQNTIAGRMAYFPIVGRLGCASSSVEHLGFWQIDGYGLMSMYKSDWERFGGENNLSTMSYFHASTYLMFNLVVVVLVVIISSYAFFCLVMRMLNSVLYDVIRSLITAKAYAVISHLSFSCAQL